MTWKPFHSRFLHEVTLLVLLLGFFLPIFLLDPTFLSPSTQLSLAPHSFELALLALPMTFLIISGGIDLSVGSAMALCAVVMGLLFESGAPMPLAALAAIATGAAAGILNGLFIAKVRVHPLIVTLATLAAFRGLAEGISLGRPISGFPEPVLHLGDGTVAGIPIPILIFLAALLVAAAIRLLTVPGFWIYAIGDNERAARRAGIPVERVQLALYTASGAAAGLAAIIYAARRNTAKADIGTGLELDVITAVVLGGTSIFGGRGSLLGTLLGIAILHELHEFVSRRWSQDELILIVVGVILIVSVLLNNAFSRRQR
jgi:rhamnose transport system permease protein